jgi:hypothetical protein
MTTSYKCPVCQNKHGGIAILSDTSGDYKHIRCDLCGEFNVSGTLLATGLRANGNEPSPVQIAALTHLIRQQNDNGRTDFKLTNDWLEENIESLKLPSPAQQATNCIRYIGNFVVKNGIKIDKLPGDFFASAGFFNKEQAEKILLELKNENIIHGKAYREATVANGDGTSSPNPARLNKPIFVDADLTLKGWELYEAEKRGKIAGNYGFIAMKFGDAILDPFVTDVLKPHVRDSLSIDVVDMRDSSKAGIIDNIMRERIRDARFVLVDLTHGNAGAYWEAGYAEGLGKPVIYLCEQTKFDEEKTHFDTNHCTTVTWSKDGDNQKFKDELIATLRRSLNLFE